jgi:methylmalonyl-CoA mutase cobalamin-binding domain/chain
MELTDLSNSQRDLLEVLKDSIVAIDDAKAKEMAEEVIAAGIDPNTAIKTAIASAAIEVGKKFDDGDYFLPHLVMAGDVMDEVGAILEKSIPVEQVEKKKIIVIATVEADMHSVGKNLVSTMLRAAGFEVHDMGVDVSSLTIIQKAKEVKADMIALSSLLTTTMPYMREVVDDLKSMGIRDDYKVMIGGGPVSRSFGEEIGADGYGSDAIEAVDEAKKVLFS